MDGLEPTSPRRHSMAFSMLLILNFKMVAKEPCLHIEASWYTSEAEDQCENR